MEADNSMQPPQIINVENFSIFTFNQPLNLIKKEEE